MIEDARDDARANDKRERDERADFEDREPERQRQCPDAAGPFAEDHGQQHEHQDREQIFDHEPADRDVAGRGVQIVVIGQDAREYDRARHGKGEPKDDAGRPVPAERASDDRTETRGRDTLNNGPRDSDSSYGEKFIEVKLQANAEHEQDDADLGELFRNVRIGHEAGRVRADHDPGDQVADNRR